MSSSTKKKQKAAKNGNGAIAPLVSEVEAEEKNPPSVQRDTTESRQESDAPSTKTPNQNDNKTIQTPRSSNRILAFLLGLLRVILLDTPLALVFGVYLSTLVVNHIHLQYLKPQLDLQLWTPQRQMQETTYYHRKCDLNDLTATTVDELIISKDTPTETAVHQQLKHGVTVYPDFLPQDLITRLRNFILERNKIEQGFWVIEGENRFSFGIAADMDPAVSEALQKIATHDQFRPILEKVVGKNPSIIEFTAITSMPGAKDQFWHADVLPYGNNIKTTRSMIPSYSLFITLQNTTAAMGATGVCPGSHVCAEEPQFCHSHGFQVSGPQDNWQSGTAFMFNQAFYHRGTGHHDFNAPDRATFILTFAPRPQFRKGELETRQLSQGGSYSQRWDQWGHTLKDLEHADTVMVQPWTTLRALGIYKPSWADWGWDMVTVASMRITNDDNGYHDFNLEEFLDNGGFKYLPKFLEGSMEGYDEDGEEALWYTFLVDTLEKCMQFAAILNVALVGVYLLIAAIVDLAVWMAGSEKKGSVLFGSLKRLIVTHGLVALLAAFAVHHVDSSQWAQQIRSGMLYTLPFDAPSNDSVETSSAGTLPNTHDVLIPFRLNSDFMASYNDILHVSHPANAEWKKLVAANAEGYMDLPPFMKQQVSQGIVNAIKENNGRFLIQGIGNWGRWSELPPGFAEKRTHAELMMESHPLLKAMNGKVEHLLSETRYGVLRKTALARKHTPKLLYKIQQDLMQLNDVDTTTVAVVQKPRYSSGLGPVYTMPVIPTKTTRLEKVGHTNMPPHPSGGPPFPSAWVTEQEIVEGKYQGKFDEWYRGRLVHASSWDVSYNIVYDDGEEDAGLDRGSIRPFEPYKVGELVQARMHDDHAEQWSDVRVVTVHPDGTYELEMEGDLRKRLYPVSIRRTTERVLKLGAKIEARYQGEGDSWFGGIIAKVRDDGTYDVNYDDGDRELEVESQHIRLAV